ncbi:type II toxin-antitoxin system YafQ family toxin [Yersinia massiliensis]|uniref:mRNA interferase YafQ n=2 Tax=Yersinia TaxID=629 RepID=A0AAI8ZMC6_YERFR|nr:MULTISPECIES: type II toxin-antitoxin system YafQ family toxin [Yersinia]HEC1648902.1 type II toxin-antitoxin system YafQ family toxin [Yersinia enterocolitica]MCB5309443.1 type II toxin-antitoxin system YafQ family toxin [Yersinia massiliensis]MDA5546989.1 type II toxin-antitoxin system YafQ family toxin [Yersinia massiliensis]MDN0127175.1 type II toxin-antitoxin system YafQ family toxin [Yersinia massiliensis]NIL26578.1 type II toxin-antitoxin system YafQ family toxin [Yersinia massiliens
MLTIVYQSRFKKDAKRYANNKKAQKVILDTISLLQTGEALPLKYKEHPLIGNYIGYLECHGMPDLLLIYQRTKEEIKLYRVGSHSDLF